MFPPQVHILTLVPSGGAVRVGGSGGGGSGTFGTQSIASRLMPLEAGLWS